MAPNGAQGKVARPRLKAVRTCNACATASRSAPKTPRRTTAPSEQYIMGQYHCWNRYDDPATGRWTTPDPVATPFSNLFDYAGNEPTRRRDPKGTWVPIAIGIGIGIGVAVLVSGCGSTSSAPTQRTLATEGDNVATSKCAKFTLKNVERKTGIVGGASDLWGWRVEMEPTENCCECKQIKLIAMVLGRDENGSIMTKVPNAVHDPDGWFVDKIDPASGNIDSPWMEFIHPKTGKISAIFGDCTIQPRGKAIGVDTPGFNHGGSQEWMVCGVCDDNATSKDFYGCIRFKVSHSVQSNKEIIPTVQMNTRKENWDAAWFNADKTVAAWNGAKGKGKIPTVVDCCVD